MKTAWKERRKSVFVFILGDLGQLVEQVASGLLYIWLISQELGDGETVLISEKYRRKNHMKI